MATWFVFGLILGGGIGALGMWLYLMQKYAGRPVDWTAIAVTTAGALLVLTLTRLL